MSKQNELVNLARTGASGGGNKNLVINGGFQVFQRATAATTVSNSNYQTADRWRLFESTDGAYTTERSTDTPSGTGYSLKAVVTTADTSIAATQYASIEHYIEGQNCQHLLYGTSSAKTLTLSFYVKSSKTGTYTISLYKPDTTGYNYTREYTIDAANTWEKKELTITPTAGSTSFITASGGAIGNDNGLGLALGFNLAWGSNFNGGTSDVWSATVANYSTTNAVNWMDTVGNTFFIAEVQLEVGEKATDFEHENYGTTLSKCERYHQRFVSAGVYPYFTTGRNHSSTVSIFTLHYRTEMRSNPSMSISDAADIRIYDGNDRAMTGFQINGNSTTTCGINFTGLSSGVGNNYAAQAYFLDNVNGYVALDAEL